MTLDCEAKRQIARACQYAAVFDATEIKVASYANSNSSQVENSTDLAKECVRYVISALRSNAGCAEPLEIVPAVKSASSPRKEASATEEDRVEVIIMLPK